jgi:hypothetical protein
VTSLPLLRSSLSAAPTGINLPSQPRGADQAAYAHTVKAPATASNPADSTAEAHNVKKKRQLFSVSRDGPGRALPAAEGADPLAESLDRTLHCLTPPAAGKAMRVHCGMEGRA